MKTQLKNFIAVSAIWIIFVVLSHGFVFAPLVGDDFINPFSQFYNTQGKFVNAMQWGLTTTLNTHISFFGMFVGAMYQYLWITFDGVFHGGHYLFYQLTKILLLIILLESILKITNKLFKEKIHQNYLRVLIVFVLVSTYQIHGNWSNDPVTSYPVTGLGSTILLLIFILNYLKLRDKNYFKNYVVTFIVLMITLFFYEMNLVLIPTIFMISTYLLKIKKISLSKFLLEIGIFNIIPVLTVIFLKILNRAVDYPYNGTSIDLNLKVFRTLFIQIYGYFPLSTIPFAINIGAYKFKTSAIHILLPTIILIAMFFLAKKTSIKSNKVKNDINNFNVVITTVFLGLQMIFTAMLFSITPKYQNELNIIGKVYMNYIVGLVAIGILLIVITVHLNSKHMLTVILTVGLLTSYSNIHQLNLMRFNYRANSEVITAFNSDSPKIRCQSLNDWLTREWPDYYKQGIISGLNFSHERIYKEPYCDVKNL